MHEPSCTRPHFQLAVRPIREDFVKWWTKQLGDRKWLLQRPLAPFWRTKCFPTGRVRPEITCQLAAVTKLSSIFIGGVKGRARQAPRTTTRNLLCVPLRASERRRDLPYKELVNRAKHTVQALAWLDRHRHRPSCQIQTAAAQEAARLASLHSNWARYVSEHFFSLTSKPKSIC